MHSHPNTSLPFKSFILVIIILSISSFSEAQIFKRIKDGFKDNLENRATDKINQEFNKGVDSVTKRHPKKKGADKKDSTVNPAGTNMGDNAASDNNTALTDSINTYNTPGDAAGPDAPGTSASAQQDGFVSIATSANSTFIGASLIISGESVFYGKFNAVGLIIQGPYTEDADPKPLGGYTKQLKQVPLDKDGKFKTNWNVGANDGEFIITVKSSDGKATKTKKVFVNSWPDMGDMADSNIDQTTKAYNKLVKRVDAVKPNISSADAAELDKKMAEIKDKKDAAIKLFSSLNAATKKLGTMVAKGKSIPLSLSENLSTINNTLSTQASDMARMDEFSNHEPSDNTICEYMVMVNEASAAFSTFTNIYANTITLAVGNIVSGKIIPREVELGNNAIGNPVPPDNDIALKEPGKLYAASKIDAGSLVGKMATASFVGDITQFVSSYLLKKYCGLYEGTIKHDYTVIFRNSDHIIWWKYGVEMQADISLRYPKGKNTGRTIKMKGNIEGNATKFTFFADAKEAVKDEMQGREKYVEVLVLKDFLPPSVPFASSLADKVGFGAVARGIATPAYFNIPIDADYDLDKEKIKFFINPALVDFSPIVQNRELYMVLAVLPMIRWMEYPIFKAQETIKGSFKERNEFSMSGGKSPKPQLSDKVARHINDENAPFEIFLNSTIALKKQ